MMVTVHNYEFYNEYKTVMRRLACFFADRLQKYPDNSNTNILNNLKIQSDSDVQIETNTFNHPLFEVFIIQKKQKKKKKKKQKKTKKKQTV